MCVLTKVGICCAVLIAASFAAQKQGSTDSRRVENLQSFDLVWKTLHHRYWDESMGGLAWDAVRDKYRLEVEHSTNTPAAREAMGRMIHLLPSSHLAIIPGSLYKTSQTKADSPREKSSATTDANDSDDEDQSGSIGISVGVLSNKVVVFTVEPQSPSARQAIRAGWTIESVDDMSTELLFSNLAKSGSRTQLVGRVATSWLAGPPGSKVTVLFRTPDGQGVKAVLTREVERGEKVQFGNLPPEHVEVEHRLLENGVGYIRLSLFLDPVRVMPEIEKAVTEFRRSPGIVFDLRNNPGGIGVMAMGIAGWFVPDEGKQLGTMTSRDSTFNFVVNRRAEPFEGRLALLVNEDSASTSEILAQGMKDLHRARIFGTRTAGAALPSNIIALPNGDRFQYPEANYTSTGGRVLEGNGVEPDVVIAPTIEALSAGRDLVLEAAKGWCAAK